MSSAVLASLSLSLFLSPSLYVTQRRRERVLPHIPYHHAREVKIFARKNFSQQVIVKTLKNILSVVFKILTLCSYNFWQGAGFESCSVAFSFFLLSFSFLFPFRFCFVCLFVLLLMFLKYIPSRAKIVFLLINNLNFHRFLQFSFLFYCNIFYKNKTVATCIACVASVSVWFRSKERPGNGIIGFGRARSETRALLLAPFFARSLTLLPRSLLLNRTETLATQATTCSQTAFYYIGQVLTVDLCFRLRGLFWT